MGENPIKSLDVFKLLVSTIILYYIQAGSKIKKVELGETEASKTSNYREELWKISNLEIVDGEDRDGNPVDTTVYDDEEDFDMDDLEEGEDFDIEDDEEFDEEDDDEFEEDEDEDGQPKEKKPRRA